jgi:hypothetical protein
MSVPTFALAGLLAMVFPALIWATFKKLSLGLSTLILALPILSLSRRVFDAFGSMPFPSPETLAVLVVWGCAQVRSLKPPDSGLSPLRTRRDTLTGIGLGTFLLACVVSSLLSADPGLSFKIALAGGLIPVLVFAVAVKSDWGEEDVKYLTWGLFGVTAQTALHTLLTFHARAALASGQELYSWMYREAPAASLFIVPSVTVSVVVVAIPIAIWYGLSQRGTEFATPHSPLGARRLPLRTLFVPVLLISSAVLVVMLSLSRGSWSGAAVAVIGSLPLLLRRGRARAVLLIGAVLAVFMFTGANDILRGSFGRRMSTFQFGGLDANIDLRNANYVLALQSAPRYLFTGLGLGQYMNIYAEFPNALASLLPRLWFAHSLFLTLIPEIGLLGTIALLFVFVRLLGRGLRSGGRTTRPYGTFAYSLSVGVLSYLMIASTTGAHLVSYLLCNPRLLFYDTDATYFAAPALIVVFAALGAISVIGRNPDTALAHGPTPVSPA